MSIMGVVYYDRYTDTHHVPAWARAERYEYCEDFLSGQSKEKKSSLLGRITALMLSIF